MNSIALKTHTDVDGWLRLDIPTGLIDTDLEVIVIMQPVTTKPTTKPEDLGWPPGFFEKTFGSFKDEPLERPEQGEYEQREELL
jgi:hypothetical protein